jgi:hypothetical protein
MLYLFTLSRRFINFMQSGCYVDYIIKKITETLVKNVFIYAALFFGEKFVIEFISKKSVDSAVLFVKTKVFNRQYHAETFYRNIIMFITGLVMLAEYLFFFG